jgi:multidrug resistance efflux pump
VKITRLVIGFLVIAIAIAVISQEQLSGTSANAVINARLTTIRAPIAGTLSVERRALGTQIAEGEPLGSIGDPIVDEIRLNDLIQEHAIAIAERNRLQAGIVAIARSADELGTRMADYRRQRIRELEARSGGGSFDDDGPAAQIVLESARQGIFLGDGYNDAPFSEQRLVDLRLRIEEARAALSAQDARVAALDARISSERLRVNRLSSSQLASNVRGTLWEALAGNGETVQRGQDLIRLVDCGSSIVTLSVTEGIYNRLRIGDSATFRLGTDGRTFEGTITRLAGSGAATIYRNLAIAPSEQHLERFDVTLLSPALRDSDVGCAVGRTGRVFFDARPLDRLRGLWS